MIPYSRQNVTQSDIDAVIDVLRSDFLTQGPMVPTFEQTVAAYCGAGHAVAVSNATSALHISCLALGLGSGDWLWTSPVTFVASANCALYCGARVDFVDIDPHSYNLSVIALERKLAEAEQAGRLPKIVVPVHLCGQSCDMRAIADLAKRYGFKVIEDASHAVGGRYLDSPVGNCRYSDITIFSFHPVKIITTAEGGMAVTNDADLTDTLRLLRSHGITRDPERMTHAPDGPWYYQQIVLGYNYRMNDVQAALGVSQMQRLDDHVTLRHRLAQRYDQLLADLPVVVPRQSPDTYSALHLYPIRLQPDRAAAGHRQVFKSLRDQGIGVNLHYIPVHLQPYYRDLGFTDGDFPEAESYYREAISLPLFPTLAESEQNRIADALRRAIRQ